MRSITVLLAFALALTLSSSGQAHYSTTFFEGVTRENKDGRTLKDPINFVFYGGAADQSDYTRARIEQHMADDWRSPILTTGGERWRKDVDIIGAAKQDQRVYWRDGGGLFIKSDRSDWHGSNSTKSYKIGNQIHARFWDDKEHSEVTPQHGRRHQWVLGGIHEDRLVLRKGVLPSHAPARDWDVMRVIMRRAMKKHCSKARWDYHPESARELQGFLNSGYIDRYSLHHADDGGCDGYL